VILFTIILNPLKKLNKMKVVKYTHFVAFVFISIGEVRACRSLKVVYTLFLCKGRGQINCQRQKFFTRLQSYVVREEKEMKQYEVIGNE
jgi:hypothetical protein